MTDPRAIAAGLSEAQKRALTNSVFEVSGQVSYRNGRLATRADKRVLWNLRCLGLLADYIGSPLLTPLGLAVRKALQEQPHLAR